MDVSPAIEDEEPGTPLVRSNVIKVIGVSLELISDKCLKGVGTIQQRFVQIKKNCVDHSLEYTTCHICFLQDGGQQVSNGRQGSSAGTTLVSASTKAHPEADRQHSTQSG